MTKNIYVFEGGGSNPKPLAVIDMSKYSENDSKAISAILYKKVNNVFTLEIDIPTNCDASQSITNTSDLVLYDTEGNLQEFHVTEVSDLHEYSVIRTVYAEQSISELIENIITSSVEMPTTTNPADYLAYILSFTRWSVGTVDSGIYNSRWKEDLTGKTCLEALQMFMDKFNCEFIVRYESDNKNRIVARYIDIKKTIGNNYGKRFEDTKDINALKRNLDLDSIKTAIYPRIAKQSNDENGNTTVEYIDISTVDWSVAAGDPVDKPLGQTILVDPDANTMYKRLNNKTGKLQERIMYAEWTEQTAKDAEDLCKQAWRILKANSVIYPSYEVTASDLYRLSGNNSDYAHEQVSLGDTCIIIDRKITPELRATTRVVEIEEDLLNPINNKYVFGKYRQTLATSNIDQQKSIEEKLAELSGRIQGMTIPEVKPQYQSGKAYYEDIKQDIQNEFMSSNGYVMAEDSNGFWVMDAPQGGTPTKALILKGGNLAIATYNTVTSAWEVGTFINGTSVNADYINTGHIAADVIAAHSITTDHLAASAVQYIRTGMATDEDLQGVMDSVANDYATKDSVSSNINNAVKDLVSTSNMNSAISNAIADMATNSSVNSAINNIVIGGRNLFLNSDFHGGKYAPWRNSHAATLTLMDNPTGKALPIPAKKVVRITGCNGQSYGFLCQTVVLETNTYYTVTFWAYVPSSVAANTASISIYYNNSGWQGLTVANMISERDTWVKKTVTFKTHSTYGETILCVGLTGDTNTVPSKSLYCCLAKLEKGNKATDWTPAPEDVEEQNRITRINAIKDLQKQLQAEYSENNSKANKVYSDQYLPVGSTAKVNLNNKMTAYTTAYNNYNNYITTMIADGTVTEAEYNQYNTYATAYAIATKSLAEAIEDANSARLANVYSQARQGMVTTADLEVNNEQVIASAKQGMVSTAEMTDAISIATKDLVSIEEMNTTISNATDNLVSATELNNQIAPVKIEPIKQSYNAIKVEYSNNKKQADTLYANTNLKGTAKSNLNSAISDYSSKFSALTTVYNDIINKGTFTEAQASAWSTAVTNLNTSTTTLAQKMQEANIAINTEIANAYAEGIRTDVGHDITEVTVAVNTLRNDVNTTIKDGIIEEAEAIAIQSNIDMLNSEKADVDKEYAALYANSNLTGMYKSSLKSNKDAYDANHTALIKAINDAIADNKVTKEERTNINGKFTTYNVALANYRDSVVAATDAIAANRVSNATKNLVDNTTMSNAIDAAVAELPTVSDVESAKNNAIIAANIETIKQTFKSITNEYNSNHKQADTIYKDSYLAGTAKTNLSNAMNDYNTKYNAAKTAHDDIVNKATLSTAQLNSWNTAVTNMQSSTTNLAQRIQEAQTYINTAIYNASKNYTDQAIPDALTGYAKTSYVDSAKADAIADAKKGMVSTSQLEVNNTEILMKTASMGQYNILRNSDFRSGTNYWFKYDGSQAPNSWGIVNDSDAVVISGEKAMRTWINNGSGATVWNGFYQDVTLATNTSYTLSYWICNYQCTGRVSVWKGTANDNMLASKLYNTPTNGNHNRESWIYDSVTFTTSTGGTYRMFFQTMDAPSNGGYGLFLIKPMLCTGINAQAWTAHPDEIHIGVVSVTEERGIMVEHSDADSYSTLDSDGLKIWEYGKGSPVASFGESNTAHIDTISTKKIVCDTIIPTINMDFPLSLYFSSTGSGDYSGKDSSNCCAGFTGVMSELCRRKGIDSTYVHGNFNITGSGWLHLYGVGNYLDEDIKLHNIYSTAPITIELPAEMIQTGKFELENIYGQLLINGKRSSSDANNGAIIKRSSPNNGISIRNCSCVTVQKLRFSNTTNSGYGINIDIGSTVYITSCDFCNFNSGIKVNGSSTVFIDYCRGTSSYSGTVVYGSLVIYNGSVPAGNSSQGIDYNIYLYNCSAKLKGTASDSNTKPKDTLQTAVPVASKAVTSCFSALAYQSTRQYSVTDLCQASWGGSGGFGDYRGNIFFGNSLKNWLSKASRISAQIYLQRQSFKHGNTNAKIKIEGTDVGTLALGEGKWFTVPSSVIAGLKDGSLVSIELNGTGNDYYCRFEKNVILKVTATKDI